MNLIELSVSVAGLAGSFKKEVARRRDNSLRKAITKNLFVKQYEETEGEIVDNLAPVFQDQIKDIHKRLLETEVKNFGHQAHDLASLVFDPQEWNEKVIDKTLPILALNMVRAGVAAILTFGIDVRKSSIFNTKQTGSEWFEDEAGDFEDLTGTLGGTSAGTAANTAFMHSAPPWMKAAVIRELRSSFDQVYWESISITTQGDAEKILEKGLSEHWSIRKMAQEMMGSLGGNDYAKMRATKIARTEAGNSLNGMRKESLDHLQAELGAVIPMQIIWLSILSDATRDEHAALDGVPADSEGMWTLTGVKIPWPGHYTLPPEMRVNCMCTIVSEIGMTDEEARILIDEHEAAIAQINAEGEE